jgi:hypothetical protein
MLLKHQDKSKAFERIEISIPKSNAIIKTDNKVF